MKTSSSIFESETTSGWNWKVIRDGEAGRRGARWQKVTFTLDFGDFLALKGLCKWPFKSLWPLIIQTFLLLLLFLTLFALFHSKYSTYYKCKKKAINSALKLQCHIVKHTLIQTAFLVILPTGILLHKKI